MSKSVCMDTNNVYYQRFVKFMDLLLNKYGRKVFNVCSFAEKKDTFALKLIYCCYCYLIV